MRSAHVLSVEAFEIMLDVFTRPYYDQRVVAKFKADSEAPPLHGHLRIGEFAFERLYDNRFRLLLQGAAESFSQWHKMKTAIIIGAGPAGLTAAHELQE